MGGIHERMTNDIEGEEAIEEPKGGSCTFPPSFGEEGGWSGVGGGNFVEEFNFGSKEEND